MAFRSFMLNSRPPTVSRHVESQWTPRRQRRGGWPHVGIDTPLALLVALLALAGFWWLDGYHLVVERYYQGIASERVYCWVWANLAAALLTAGLAPIAGLASARRSPALWLVGGTLIAIVFADLSGLSTAEVGWIWLPFTVWLTAATAFLPARTRKPWLAVQEGTALLVNHLLLTNW